MSKQRKLRGKHSGVPISPKLQEEIIQVYAVNGSITKTAQKCGVTQKTVKKYLDKKQPAELLQARIDAHKELAGITHSKALNILESIKPEDIESGRFPIEDVKGNIVGYKYFGPTLMQKVTSAAILTDKLKVLNEVEAMMHQDRNESELMIPGDIQALVHGIKGKLRGLSILNVRFTDENPDLSQRIQNTLEEAEAVADAKPTTGEVLDFDNPNEIDA